MAQKNIVHARLVESVVTVVLVKVTNTNRCQHIYPSTTSRVGLRRRKMSDKQQRLVLSIIDFLNQSINDGTVREEDKESLEVAGTFIPLRFLISVLFTNLLPRQFNVSAKLSASIQQTKDRWIA